MNNSLSGVLNPEFLVRSEHYRNVMDETVLPFLKERESHSFLTVQDRTSLYCVSYQAEQPRGTVVIVHGFTENAFKYAELIHSLLLNHYSVLAYDQRGHGRSDRSGMIKDPSVTHVDRFDDYVSDLKAVTDHFLPDLPRPWLLFSHSMGGAVSALFLERWPDVFSAAVLASPMIAPDAGLPSFLVSAVTGLAGIFGRRCSKPFFMRYYSGPEDFRNSAATDRNRFSWYDGVRESNAEFHNCVPSYGWIREAVKVTGSILSAGAPERISCPVYLFSAENDNTVLREPQKAFISRVSAGKYSLVHNSRHEIFRSTDEVLFPWWRTVLAFYRNPAAADGTEDQI